MPRTSDKRERLIDAAKSLFHRQGFTNTTLAHIAKYSEVPLGNVYYYFKTKEDIGAAVIETRHAEISQLHIGWDSMEDPRSRLLSYLDSYEEAAEGVAKNGCPVGSLCQELNKDNTSLSEKADGILESQLNWLTGQFDELGSKDASKLAAYVVTSIQGGSLLANSLHDESLLTDQVHRLKSLVENI